MSNIFNKQSEKHLTKVNAGIYYRRKVEMQNIGFEWKE